MEPADYIIASGVVIPILFDFLAWRKGYKTVSIRFSNFLEDPKTRALFVSGWTILTVHLFMKLPLPFQTTIKKAVIKPRSNWRTYRHNKESSILTGNGVEWNI